MAIKKKKAWEKNYFSIVLLTTHLLFKCASLCCAQGVCSSDRSLCAEIQPPGRTGAKAPSKAALTSYVIFATVIALTWPWLCWLLCWSRRQARKLQKTRPEKQGALYEAQKDLYEQLMARAKAVWLVLQGHAQAPQSGTISQGTAVYGELRARALCASLLTALTAVETSIEMIEEHRRQQGARMAVPTAQTMELEFVLGQLERAGSLFNENELRSRQLTPLQLKSVYGTVLSTICQLAEERAVVRAAQGRIEAANGALGSPAQAALETKVLAHMPFSDPARGSTATAAAAAVAAELAPKPSWLADTLPWLHQYPYFYGLFLFGYAAVFLSFVVGLRTRDSLGRSTFLSLPPQYDFGARLQRVGTAFIFAFMHTTLYCLGWLAVPMWRGIHQWIVARWPRSRAYVPFDDFIFFHKLCGSLCFLGLIMGASIWLVIMGISCIEGGHGDQARACLAFSPKIADAKKGGELLFDSINGGSYFDPRDNVVFLRIVVWLTWMPLLTLIIWARERPPAWIPFAFVRRCWWEICYYR